MSIAIEAANPEAGELQLPNGFWPALCVETPVADLMECEYTNGGATIRYEHEGFAGAWISDEEAVRLRDMLADFTGTEAYREHRYFATRADQMALFLEFLPVCGGFRMIQ